MKHCPFCRRTLPEDQFPTDERFLGGRSPRCSSCTAGERAPRAPDPLLSEVLPTREPPSNPWVEARRAAWLLRQTRAPGRREARKAVERAIRRGDLAPLACEYRFPGCVEWPTQAHHLSYEKGLELHVKWACKACHDRLTEPSLAKSNRSRSRA